MPELKNITVAFTGHRNYSRQADAELDQLLRELYAEGYRRFLCGMAWGWDLAAGEAVLRLKCEFGDVQLVAVVPFAGFEDMFRGSDAEQYRRVSGGADRRVVVCDRASQQSYLRRNDYLVENASVVVAWWNRVPHGGTAYTLSRARHAQLRIINLFPNRQLSLDL